VAPSGGLWHSSRNGTYRAYMYSTDRAPRMTVHPAEVQRLIQQFVEGAGSQTLAAEVLGVSQQYLCRVLHGEAAPGPRVLAHFGIRKVTVYEMEKPRAAR
jgi:hypothetical protein